MSIIHSMARKVIGGYLNASEHQNKDVAMVIHSFKLDEALFENMTHKAIVRAINKIKESGAEICDLNVLEFLERHGMPRNIQEGDEILAVMSEYAITTKSFQDYLKALRLNRASRVAI
jgi:replicative DNA helicase